MSHLTPVDVQTCIQVIDAALAFLQLSGNRDEALKMFLQMAKIFLPLLTIGNVQECSTRYYQEGKITRVEYEKIQQLIGDRPALPSSYR